jgi:hypothetical protein
MFIQNKGQTDSRKHNDEEDQIQYKKCVAGHINIRYTRKPNKKSLATPVLLGYMYNISAWKKQNKL